MTLTTHRSVPHSPSQLEAFKPVFAQFLGLDEAKHLQAACALQVVNYELNSPQGWSSMQSMTAILCCSMFLRNGRMTQVLPLLTPERFGMTPFCTCLAVNWRSVSHPFLLSTYCRKSPCKQHKRTSRALREGMRRRERKKTPRVI